MTDAPERIRIAEDNFILQHGSVIKCWVYTERHVGYFANDTVEYIRADLVFLYAADLGDKKPPKETDE